MEVLDGLSAVVAMITLEAGLGYWWRFDCLPNVSRPQCTWCSQSILWASCRLVGSSYMKAASWWWWIWISRRGRRIAWQLGERRQAERASIPSQRAVRLLVVPG